LVDVRGTASLLDAVRRCWASLWTARAIGYRQRMGIEQQAVAMGIVVQRLIPAELSGVLFTANPLTGDASELVINAHVGLGEALVSGTVTPDAYVLDKESGETRSIVTQPDGATPVLSDLLLRELATIGLWVEHFFGGVPQDVEWAVADGQCWLLQARPITTLPSTPATESRAALSEPDAEGTTLHGLAASPGLVTGWASVVQSPTDLAAMAPGTILICPALTPAWTPLLGLAAGLVTEDGGVLAHGAIVAREYGVPAVMGLGDATGRIRSGQRITVDGDAGTVTLLAAED
jgi:pyruvate,water dikinase